MRHWTSVKIYAQTHLPGYCDAVAIQTQEAPVVSARDRHKPASQSQGSRGGRGCVGMHRVWLHGGFAYI